MRAIRARQIRKFATAHTPTKYKNNPRNFYRFLKRAYVRGNLMTCPTCNIIMAKNELLPLMLYVCPDCGLEAHKTRKGKLHI